MNYSKLSRIAIVAATALIASGCSKSTDYSVIKNELRAPAYPLITIDPYASAWSKTDRLYDSQVSHWSFYDFPLLGVISVDGQPYRFMGVEKPELRVVIPTSQQEKWNAKYTMTKPSENWASTDFDDSRWQEGVGAFGTKSYEPTAVTDWPESHQSIWVRRTVEINEDLSDVPVYLQFSNNDDAEFYINGKKVHSTGFQCNTNRQIELSPEARSALKQGTNIIAASCNNPIAGGIIDFGLMTPITPESVFANTAQQTSVDVQATQTHYCFDCGPVDLNLTFTAPLFLDNLDLISRPVNYVTYDVKSNDGQSHEVKLYFEASPQLALNVPGQKSESDTHERNGLVYLRAGSVDQDVLAKAGDHMRIDWGYFYMAAPKSDHIKTLIASTDMTRNAFVGNDNVEEIGEVVTNMSLTHDLGRVKEASNMLMIGYDDLYSIQYFGDNLRPYWNRTGDKTIESQFDIAYKEYPSLLKKCYEFDRNFMKDYTAAGGKEYAEMCATAYRQAIAAHKLVESPDGELLLFSKENDSNGSIGTVDITYPTAPLFLYYNPELAKATMNHIFHYSESGRWDKPFAAHDVGTYPKANGQTYGGDMPVEESGNMLILTAAIAKQDGNADYAQKHWNTLTTWADYLVENGLNPENQLCTDDFAGHFAHNTNLSIKAILGIASYADLANQLGQTQTAQKYSDIAKDYAQKWEEAANDGDHYRLTFDKEDTWSQKYNLVWDRLLGYNIFPTDITEKEVKYYQTKQNEYGLPLDNRRSYTKSDWIMWTATLDGKDETFDSFMKPLHKFYNETEDRVPMSDWVYTDSPKRSGFMARAVVGGYWIKMLDKKGGAN